MNITVDEILLKDKQVKKIRLVNDKGMEVECLNLGGIITKIMVPDRKGNIENVVLGYKNLDDYLENPCYFGALIGRNAGRIYKGQITIHDKVYSLGKTPNQKGHTLHGGEEGLDKKIWKVETFEELGQVGVHLHCASEDGDEGYPGCVNLTVTYILREDNVFEISYYGMTDKDTLLNMTNHSYFNLSGNAKYKVTEQLLYIDSDKVAEMDGENIPTGKLVSVRAHDELNFQKEKSVGRDIEHAYLKAQKGYDHGWKLNKRGEVDVTFRDQASGRKMSVNTTNEAVIIYSLNFPEPLELDNGQVMGVRDGICFETQSLPIGYDECFKESSLLKAGEIYKAATQFRFTIE